MLILGLLLILGSAALTAGLVYDGSEPATVEVFSTTIDNMTTARVFIGGAATMLLFLLGVWLLKSSMARSRRQRIERKTTHREERNSAAQLEQERVALAAENQRLSAQLGDRQGTDTTVEPAPTENTGTAGAHTRTEADQR
jgi:ABC-type nickel/cobalt efflux system permease component RcnA